MVSKNVLKTLQLYYGNLDSSAAILDEDFSLYWSTDEPLFKAFTDVFEKPEKLPIINKTIISLIINGIRTGFIITPCFRSKNCVGCYICQKIESDSVCELLRATEISDVFISQIGSIQAAVNSIININQLVSERLGSRDYIHNQVDLMKRQLFYANKILVENSNVNLLFTSPAGTFYKKDSVDVGDLLQELCSEISRVISKSDRKLVYAANLSRPSAQISERCFMTAFMNIIRNAVYSSPERSSLQVTAVSSNGEIEIQIKSKLSLEKKEKLFESPVFSQSLIKKLIREGCGGTCEFSSGEDNEEIVRFVFPSENNSKQALKSNTVKYIDERVNIVHLYINEIIDNENE